MLELELVELCAWPWEFSSCLLDVCVNLPWCGLHLLRSCLSAEPFSDQCPCYCCFALVMAHIASVRRCTVPEDDEDMLWGFRASTVQELVTAVAAEVYEACGELKSGFA